MSIGYVLYLNLWGTTAKLIEADDGGVYFRPQDLIACQRKFHGMLSNMEQNFAVRSAGDIAYVVATDFEPLVAKALWLFNQMMDGEHLWPLRGAIACGDEKESREFVGQAIVDAAHLEKAALKGARLFATEQTISSTTTSFLHRPSMVRGLANHEINWLQNPSPGLTSWLTKCADHLLETDSNYCRQLGSSLKDLQRWT